MAEAGYRMTGRVQGVGFRWWTRSLANRLGVSGTVRNLPDGAVVVHARASEARLAELRAQLAKGPPGALVDAVEPLPFSPDGFRDGEFAILR
jgi:acylphosphatase